jgi:hypothetical protein
MRIDASNVGISTGVLIGDMGQCLEPGHKHDMRWEYTPIQIDIEMLKQLKII